MLNAHLNLLQKKQLKKTAEAIGDLLGNKIANRITKVLKTSSLDNEEENIGHNKEIHREGYISPEKRRQIINDLRLIK